MANDCNGRRLPILIVPGFMSSGLYVKESSTKPSWTGERIWINLTALGFEAAHLKRRHDISRNETSGGVGDSDSDSDREDEHDVEVEGEGDGGKEDEEKNEEEERDEETPSYIVPVLPGQGLGKDTDKDTGKTDTKPDSDTANSSRPSHSNESANRDKVLRNSWLHHMALADDMISERTGIQVRNIEGLAAVDYLSPGALTSLLSYVFGPVIRALQKAGYEAGKDLDAAPYDWRLAPSTLETRDKYFTRTIAQIEEMYAKNEDTPIVLVCHSMGCKIGHYFLNYAKFAKGQDWLDKYIHTYCPIGGPHIGAPKALRSFVSGDKMGLDTFLSDSEALVMGRSLGSGPLLLPAELPPVSPPTAIMRSDWALEVTVMSAIDSDVFLNNREDGHTASKMRLTATFQGLALSTPFNPVDSQDLVKFNETFQFRTDDGLSDRAALTLMFCEPGLSRARKSKTNLRGVHLGCRERFFGRWHVKINGEEAKWGRPPKDNKYLYWLNLLTFWWLIWPIFRYGIEFACKLSFGITYCALWCFFQGTVLSADELSKISGASSVTALVKIKNVRQVVLQGRASDEAHEVNIDVDLVSYRDMNRLFSCCYDKRKTTVTLKLKWISPRSLAHPRKTVDYIICQPTTVDLPVLGKHIRSTKNSKAKYLARSGYDLLDAESLGRIFDHMGKVYKPDPCDPRGVSSTDPPPVRRVKAIYGINRPTEVGAIYKRRQAVLLGTETKAVNVFHLDRQTELEDGIDGFEVHGGIILETPNEDRPSGDGTVPFWSLNYVTKWKKDCEVTIDEIDGAEHREILADKRLHELLVDYCCPKK
jgi:hypothetical protein